MRGIRGGPIGKLGTSNDDKWELMIYSVGCGSGVVGPIAVPHTSKLALRSGVGPSFTPVSWQWNAPH
ncbi:hypothetical protein BHE74_00004091, partial [Ensete ventricosum]